MTYPQEITSVTVVIPAYNEEANLARLARQVLDEPWTDALQLDQLIVVDDCSADATGRIAQQLACEYGKVRVISHATRRGKNASIRDGFVACTSPMIAILDADIALQRGSLTRTTALLAERSDPSLSAISCINEPLPARALGERASRFQALLLAETSRLGRGSLLRVYVIKMAAIVGLVLPDTTHDDLYIPRWLRQQGYYYLVHPEAIVYTRAASGLRDFAKQTLRAWQAIAALERVLPAISSSRASEDRAHGKIVAPDQRQGISGRAVVRAVMREPLGFVLYVLWRGIIAATPATLWLPVVDHTRHDTSRSTKNPM